MSLLTPTIIFEPPFNINFSINEFLTQIVDVLYSYYKYKKKKIKNMALINQAISNIIIFFGCTGSGKSSFLYLLFNFMKNKNFDYQKYKNLLYKEDNQIKMNESKTQDIVIYTFNFNDNENLVFIDTPGLCDLRGYEYDKQHIQNISLVFNHYKDKLFIPIFLYNNQREKDWVTSYVYNSYSIFFDKGKKPFLVATKGDADVNPFLNDDNYLDNPFALFLKLKRMEEKRGKDDNLFLKRNIQIVKLQIKLHEEVFCNIFYKIIYNNYNYHDCKNAYNNFISYEKIINNIDIIINMLNNYDKKLYTIQNERNNCVINIQNNRNELRKECDNLLKYQKENYKTSNSIVTCSRCFKLSITGKCCGIILYLENSVEVITILNKCRNYILIIESYQLKEDKHSNNLVNFPSKFERELKNTKLKLLSLVNCFQKETLISDFIQILEIHHNYLETFGKGDIMIIRIKNYIEVLKDLKME